VSSRRPGPALAASSSSSTLSPSPSAPTGPFNTRGVVEAPAFVLSRPAGPGEIEFNVAAHEVEPGAWIAEPAWACRAGQIPMDARPLHRSSKRFPTRSEAVEDAMNRGLRMVCEQRHRDSGAGAWLAKVESLRAWLADAIHQVRADDETLPLRGVTVVDLFAGGHGGFSMGLASLGATIELASEIAPDARSVFERNVRPRRVHGDICSLDLSATKVDVVTMGLLCQAFSAAGKGLGFADPVLATAYRHSMRVLGEVDAKVVVIECARQFMTLAGGAHANELIARMLASGYRVQHRALNAAGFGVPQDRERSILICSRLELAVDELLGVMFPKEAAPTACVEDVLEPGLPPTIPGADIHKGSPEPARRVAGLHKVGSIDGKGSQGYRVYSTNGLGPALTASGGGRARFTGAFKVRGGARPLSPREAARMQGMPEWARQHAVHRHAMRHAGNAIAVPLAREIGRQLALIVRD